MLAVSLYLWSSDSFHGENASAFASGETDSRRGRSGSSKLDDDVPGGCPCEAGALGEVGRLCSGLGTALALQARLINE